MDRENRPFQGEAEGLAMKSFDYGFVLLVMHFYSEIGRGKFIPIRPRALYIEEARIVELLQEVFDDK
jgi:hypothetical protein